MSNKKKMNDLSELGGFVFSTSDEEPKNYFEEEETELDPSEQYLEAHFSNKGRGGKTVTVIKGFQGSHQALKSLAKELKTHCGVGGSIKDDEIIIQGNFRDKIIEKLKSKGFQVKRVGG